MTLNNKLILEPYKGEHKVKASINTGFATVAQKSNLIGLKALSDGLISLGNSHNVEIKVGQIVYYEEEVLHASGWSKKAYSCDAIEGKFILAPANQAVMVRESK